MLKQTMRIERFGNVFVLEWHGNVKENHVRILYEGCEYYLFAGSPGEAVDFVLSDLATGQFDIWAY